MGISKPGQVKIPRHYEFKESALQANIYLRKIYYWGLPSTLLLAVAVWVEIKHFSIFSVFGFCAVLGFFIWRIRELFPFYWAYKDFSVFESEMEKDAKSSSTHYKALEIINECSASGAPFCLFLRSFETEAYDWVPPDEISKSRISRVIKYHSGAGATEAKLHKILNDRISILAISNPSSVYDMGTLFPRLESTDEDWEYQVTNLAEHAAIVICECQVMSPGMSLELEIIKRLNKQDRTIIIIPDGEQKRKKKLMDNTILILHKFETPKHPVPDKNDKLLAEFIRVVYLSEIPDESPDTSPVFADLWAKIDLQNKRIESKKRYRQLRDITPAIGGDIPEASRPVIEKMLQLAIELGDFGAQAECKYMLGYAYKSEGNWGKAMAYFSEAVHFSRLAPESGYLEISLSELITCVYNNGVVALDEDNLVEAVTLFGEAWSLAEKRGDKTTSEVITYYLAVALGKSGKIEESIEAFKTSASISNEIHNEERKALSNSNIGSLLLKTNRVEEGLAALEEALRYHRNAGKLKDRIFTFNYLIKGYGELTKIDEKNEIYRLLMKAEEENNLDFP
jgi:tetratricopeptide (TPR) repeat protein